MKWKSKFAAVLLSSGVFLSVIASPVSASETQYLWNEETKQVLDSSYYDNKVVDETTSVKDSATEGKGESDYQPQWLYSTLVRYDQTKAPIDYKKKYVGQTRVDNSGNKYTSAKLIFKATSSGSWSVTGSTSVETQAELNLIVSKVNATVTVGGSATRSWSTGYEYGTETDVPPGKIGTATAYIPGASSSGYAVYKVTNDSTGEYWYENRARGAIVPAKNAWNIVVSIP